ncbi:hypothetical protein [Methylocella silvestris]|uniref:Uncharacterized protein n=1 Tax=Methylocella silvestris TaxID=199596 RepID=A0A2J7TGJ6_METSI|nr:hypothetical protein [Methylocella silvestris]PNG25876.1 hypothetical protein CR492_11110 [Methylocella silvestris]
MAGYVDPNGLSQSAGVLAAVRSHGKSFALEIVRCHNRYLAGDHERLDGSGRSYYATSVSTIVFSPPASAPWFAVVSLAQER